MCPVTISPVKRADGRIIGASKIARDITARKQAEQTARFLADASAALAELTDYESTLQKVAKLGGAVLRRLVRRGHPGSRWLAPTAGGDAYRPCQGATDP